MAHTTAHPNCVNVEVELHAFQGNGAIRMVNIPLKDFAGLKGETLEQSVLDRTFYWGQNDFQNKPCRSVSVGDIIRLNGRRFVVKNVGFAQVPAGWVPPVDEHGRLECDESRWGVTPL